MAVGLEVQPLAGRVGGDEDADRVNLGIGVEGPLDLLPLGLGRRPSLFYTSSAALSMAASFS